MIPSNITRDHIVNAIREIEKEGVPKGRESRKFRVVFSGRSYPPKYVVSLANRLANGTGLDPSEFISHEANRFLQRLGFEVTGAPSARQTVRASPISKPVFEETDSRHDERCPECKKTIEVMLKKIYGSVESNYKFGVGTKPEDYATFLSYRTLDEIFSVLQNHRGYKSFTRTLTLPHCDFFIIDPGFIVEFDESQHFTAPRKLSLTHYPDGLKLGFPKQRWIHLCDEIDAKDNDPPFRDEQRAWYDTLRDFLPEIKGLSPTVRLYSKEMRWCKLDPQKSIDVEKFQKFIESRRAGIEGDFIATVILQSNGNASNEDRRRVLLEVVEKVVDVTNSDGIILFPGGYYSAGLREANAIFTSVEKETREKLARIRRNIIVCLGIDGRIGKYATEQMAIAVGKDGVKAIGRKFRAAPQEKGHVDLASDYLSEEQGYPRIFSLNGRHYFLAACYDTFGITKDNLTNPGVDVVLDFVHGFYPPRKRDTSRGDKSMSGDVDFARKGFAGASKQWACPVFGSTVFFNRPIPERWPSGVYWNQGSKSTKRWKYDDNPVKKLRSLSYDIPEGKVLIRIYSVTECLGV